ncbi:MAG: hypothetical protein AAGF84_06975 [Planctomycetota bacterium]
MKQALAATFIVTLGGIATPLTAEKQGGVVVNNIEQVADADAPPYSFEITAAALAKVGPLSGEDLLDDETFLDALRDVLRDEELTPTDRVDAFYLLHRKIGLHFSGFAALPPDMSYAEVFWQKAVIMSAYREALADLELSAEPFAAVALESFQGGHAVRLGSSVLLAALVDPPEAQKLIEILSDPNRLKRTAVPPIVAHYIAWSTCVAGNLTHAEALAGLIPVIPLEEVGEDFALTVGFRNPGPALLTMLEGFAVDSAAEGFDHSVCAVLTVLHRHLEADAYAETWQRVRDASKDAAWSTDAIDAFRDGPPPRGGMGEPPPESGSDGWQYKLWDGFTLIAGDDSGTIQWGDAFFDTTQH